MKQINKKKYISALVNSKQTLQCEIWQCCTSTYKHSICLRELDWNRRKEAFFCEFLVENRCESNFSCFFYSLRAYFYSLILNRYPLILEFQVTNLWPGHLFTSQAAQHGCMQETTTSTTELLTCNHARPKVIIEKSRGRVYPTE